MDSIPTITICLLIAIIAGYFYNTNPYTYHRAILTEQIATEYDYIVVGGGSAGSVVAARLSEDSDKTVLLLEAGRFYDELPIAHVPLYYSMLMHSVYDWEYYTEPQEFSNLGMKGKRSYWPRGRVLGGSSVLNGVQYTRGSPFEYDLWSKSGCDGWSYNEVLPYFIKSEDIQIDWLKTSKYHGRGGPLTVSGGKVTTLTDKYLQAGRELGYEISDYNGVDQEGFSEAQFTVKKGVRASTGLSFLGSDRKRDNLDISINSFVTKVDVKKQTAVGVYFIRDGRKQYVKAKKEIIVSAGAINSPQLLMLSGIGPKDHLKDMGIPLVHDLPVGQNLQDHQCAILVSRINNSDSITEDSMTSWTSNLRYNLFGTGPQSISGIDGSAFVHIKEADKGKISPDIQFIIFSLPFSQNIINLEENFARELLAEDANVLGFTTCLSLTHPKSRGYVKLRSYDPFDHPVLNPNYLYEKVDVQNFISGIRIWEKFIETDTMKSLGASVDQTKVSFCSQHEFLSDEYWECFIRHTAMTIYHHSGTCKMGASDDATAVVDPQLRVRGIDRLRVVDASIFPNVTSGNTNAPTIMVAEKAADLIRGKNTVSQ